MTSPIPQQLHGCRFIKVKPGDKVAIEPGWQKTRNYAHDDASLLQHIASGGNYGVMVRDGICCLDADNHEAVKRTGLLKHLAGTFTVKRGDRAHYYFRCPELPAEKFILSLNGDEIGDVRGSDSNFYLVGPGCIHPSGDGYEVVDAAAPIKRVPLQDIQPIIDLLAKKRQQRMHQDGDAPARPAPGASASGGFLEGDIHEPGRNNTLTQVAGYYWSRGCTQQRLLSLVRDANIERCKPPLDDDEIRTIVSSITGRYQRGPAAPAWIPSPGKAKSTPAPAPEACDDTAAGEGEDDDIAALYPALEIFNETPPQIINRTTQDGRTVTETRPGKRQLLHGAMADRLHDELLPVSFNNKLYVYDDGVYILDDGRINRRIRDVLDFYGIRNGLAHIINEVRTHLHAMDAHGSSPFDRQRFMIAVRNGVLRFAPENNYQVELLPHSPEYLFSHRLPVMFNPDADSTTISEVLGQWLPGDEQVYLRQMAALPFYQRWRAVAKVAYILEGIKDSGKTSWLKLLAALYGAGVCGVSLDRICSDRYAVSQMEGKLLNIYDELPTVKLKNYDAFKKLSGGEAATIERKFENAYDSTITCLHVFSCNKPPKGDELDDAFYSRWNYLLFTNTFARDEKFMEKLLTEENLSAFLNIAIKELQGLLSGELEIERMDAEDVADVWQLKSNEIKQFVNDCCDTVSDKTAPPDAMVKKDDLYSVYQSWCNDNKFAVLDKSVFSKRLSRLGITGRRSLVHGRQVQHYAGLTFKSNFAPKREAGQAYLDE